MNAPLVEIYRTRKADTRPVFDFLQELEQNIDQDLWRSAGGHWSEASIEKFRTRAIDEIIGRAQSDDPSELRRIWVDIMRDFHQNQWGEQRLVAKEKKPLTEDQHITRELFTYVWAAAQTFLITKTMIMYFGIQAALDEDSTQKFWLYATITFSFCSLCFFAYRQSKRNAEREAAKKN